MAAAAETSCRELASLLFIQRPETVFGRKVRYYTVLFRHAALVPRMAAASLLPLVRCSRPDLVIVSSEGRESYSWRLLLALHSPLAARLLADSSPTDGTISSLALPSVPHAAVQAMLACLARSVGSGC
jgi:hypothetical protein